MNTILIVDDNAGNLTLLRDILERHQYTVLTTQHGAEALDTAQHTPPDLIITDVLMPVMDGFTLCYVWQQDDRLKTIPFVFYTATYTTPEDQEFGLKLGAARYLIKPLNPTELVNVVRDILHDAPLAQTPSIKEETAYLKGYNEALVRKLERKIAQLEAANQALEREIADRQQVEQKLRREHDLVEQIMQTSPTSITVVNREGKITYANAQSETVLGLTKTGIMERTYNAPAWRITDVDGAPFPEDRLPFVRVMGTGHPVHNVHHAIEWPDGRRRLLSINAAPLFDANGHIDGMVAAIEDITERVQAEKALATFRTRYERMFRNHVAIMLLINPETGLIMDANQAACQYYGYSHEQITTMLISEINTLPQEQIYKEMHYVRTEQKNYLTLKHRLASGIERDVEVFSCPVEIEQHTLLYSIIHDITERKQAEDALKISEEQYRRIFESVTDALLVADVAEATFVEVNPAACRIYGYTRDEMIGMNARDLIHPDYHPMLERFIRDIQTTGTFRGEPIELRQNGEPFHTEVKGSLIIFQNKPHVLVFVQDVTERRKAAQQHLAYEMEQARANVLQHFISHASHDLRTPLTTIKTNIYLLNKLTDPVKQQRHLDILNTQTTHLERLLEDMLNMSRLDKDIVFKFVPTNVNALVDQIIIRQRALIQQKSHTVTVTTDPAVPLTPADHSQLDHALTNILLNALHYTPDGGTIMIRTSHRDQHVMIAIADTGIGIAPNDLDHIFDRFYRVDKARGTNTGGAGLGLAIAKRIVDAHQGTIEVESEPGVGSTFTITLPCAPEN
ncbi:MAG: PAS domain S-box protein [Anaerolineae bacterium]|nr:PAS domain S-box protein [Anaerolineae bacterium]